MASTQASVILILEDDAGVARLEQRQLERAGFRVLVAATAPQAIERLEQQPIDLIVLDNHLPPALTGLDFYEQLKQRGLDVPVIIVTGFSDEATAIRALRAGARDFVPKTTEYLYYLPEAVRRVLRQVKLEHQLIESEARFQSLVHSLEDLVYTLDPEQRFTAVYGRWLDRQARTVEEFWDRTPADVFGASNAALHAAAHGRALRGAREAYEWSVPARVGTQYFHSVLAPLRSARNDILGVVGVVRDITEQKRAAERIREQAALLDKATDAILLADLADRIVFWNAGAERTYGWSAAEVLGRRLNECLVHRAAELQEAHRLVVARGEWTGELHQLTKDNKPVLVESRWSLIRGADGAPRSILIINTNITDRRKLEAQYLRAQRMESIGTLAGGIAHDLNNVLTPIMMALGLLKAPLPDEERTSLLELLENAVQHAAEMVKQILFFARGSEGEKTILPLRAFLKETDRMLRHTLPKQIELKTVIPNNLWAISADPTQLAQVLMNLCVNARDAMPTGGRLVLAAENIHLDETDRRGNGEDGHRGPYVRLTVDDTGIGIGGDIIERIFEPFFTTKEKGKGTGLGLATVTRIVKSHGGFLKVNSEIGKGTTFSVYFPAEVKTPAPMAETPLDPVEGQGACILVVDDEAYVRQITQQTLETFGYRVLTARDGTEALTQFVEHQAEIKAVITDLMMPVMDGAATIRALQQIDPNVRVIAASGLAETTQAAERIGTSVRAFLTKPFSARTLIATIRMVLETADADAALSPSGGQPR